MVKEPSTTHGPCGFFLTLKPINQSFIINIYVRCCYQNHVWLPLQFSFFGLQYAHHRYFTICSSSSECILMLVKCNRLVGRLLMLCLLTQLQTHNVFFISSLMTSDRPSFFRRITDTTRTARFSLAGYDKL